MDLFRAVMNGTESPPIYVEYKLKEKFGWTQAELEAEPLENIHYYLKIMGWESQKNANQLNQEMEASGRR